MEAINVLDVLTNWYQIYFW